MSIVYVATSTASGGGRNGHVESSNGKLKFDLTYPKELGGSGTGANPEQIVSMGYAACFLSALELVAQQRQVGLAHAQVTCSAKLHRSGQSFSLSFQITAHLPNLDQELADSLVQQTHTLCPYSKAFTQGVEIEVAADIQPATAA